MLGMDSSYVVLLFAEIVIKKFTKTGEVMTSNNDLSTRMKEYENASRIKLTRRMPMIIRIDGKAFHTYTRPFEKPLDDRICCALIDAARALLNEVQGAKIAYTQSDEISLLLTDYENLKTDAWFDKNIQKMASVSASIATSAFNHSIYQALKLNSGEILRVMYANFDARCFVLPKEEVCNYFIWRQQDATRNSIMSLAQKHFPHKKLQGVNTSQAQELLWKEKEINWNNLPTLQKRGWCLFKEQYLPEPENEEVIRTKTTVDINIPIFTQDRSYIESWL